MNFYCTFKSANLSFIVPSGSSVKFETPYIFI